MLSALICGVLGTLVSLGLGILKLNLSAGEVLLCVFGSNLGGLLALFGTQTGQRRAWVKKSVMRGALGTWLIFLSIYFATEILTSYPLRNLHNLLWLLFPLIFSGGFSIIAFGPIQDRIIARNQRRARS